MAKTMKKLDSKLQKQQQDGLKSQTQQENTTKTKIWKITTAKFKCTCENILGHDWLTKITWHKRAREVSSEFVKFKTSSTQIFSCLYSCEFFKKQPRVSFSKSKIALAEAARAISAFWKTHSCKLIPNWTRNRMITYTNWSSNQINCSTSWELGQVKSFSK